jgi:hypothetical protein
VQRIDLGYKARGFFIPFHKRTQRWAVIVAHRRCGKTYAAIHDVVDAALRCQKHEGRFALAAPTFSQVKDVMWGYLKRAVAPIPDIAVNESELWVEVPNRGGHKSRVRLYAADTSYERMRGLYFDGIVLDEYADIDPRAWPEAIRPALADREGWAVWIGTAKGRDAFYQQYAAALKEGPEKWFVETLKASETKILPQSELDDARAAMSEAQYNREFECSFDEPGIDQFISGNDVIAARQRKSEPQGPKLIGCDIARFGDDRTVLAFRNGDVVDQISIFRGIDTMQAVARIITAIEEYRPDGVFVDVVGIGAGVVDRLRQLRYPIIEVNAGSTAGDDSKYINLRSEMWAKMRLWLKDRAQLPNRDDLGNDLTSLTYKFDPRNRLQLESKADLKKRGLPSPDIADALALTFAYPIAPKDMQAARHSRQTADDYDPLFRDDRGRGRQAVAIDP